MSYAPQHDYQQNQPPHGGHPSFQQAQMPAGPPVINPSVPPVPPGPFPAAPSYGAWSDGICDCFSDCSSCCLSWCVMPYRWAMNLSRAQLMDFNRALMIMGIPWLMGIIFSIVGRFWWPGFLIELVFVAVVLALGATWRGVIRQKYRIENEDQCMDGVCWLCCGCCANAQEARQIDRATGYLPTPGVTPAMPAHYGGSYGGQQPMYNPPPHPQYGAGHASAASPYGAPPSHYDAYGAPPQGTYADVRPAPPSQ